VEKGFLRKKWSRAARHRIVAPVAAGRHLRCCAAIQEMNGRNGRCDDAIAHGSRQEPVDRDDRHVEGHREQIRRPAILSSLRQLSLWLGPRRNYPPASSPARSRITRLRGLLAAAPR